MRERMHVQLGQQRKTMPRKLPFTDEQMAERRALMSKAKRLGVTLSSMPS
jgi:hypothetical protein